MNLTSLVVEGVGTAMLVHFGGWLWRLMFVTQTTAIGR